MKELKSDIAVVAAGPSGLAAAVAAAELGAGVIVLEKSGHAGGDALRANQVFAIESRLQRVRQYTLSREEAFQIWMNHTQWGVNTRLVKNFIDKSAGTIDWLEKMGVEFHDLTSHGPGNKYTSHMVWEKTHRPGLGTASRIIDALTNKAKKLGVQIIFKTPVKQIVKEGNRITGVIGENVDNEIIKVRAKAVIIGTGGTAGYGGPGISGSRGDGIRMAKEIGAEVNDGTYVRFGKGGGLPGPTGSDDPIVTIFGMFNYPHLAVNLFGERFMDEEIAVTSMFAPNAIVNQKDHCAFSIFDENAKHYFIKNGFEFPFGFGIAQFPKIISDATNFDTELNRVLEKGSDIFFKADSLEELASQTGINLEGLRKTINDYNITCTTGRDEFFHKKARYLKPVKKPKFYARKNQVAAHGLPDGIKTNYRTEVITQDFDVIPGLYAIGADAFCNIHKEIYPNIMPGNALGFCFNSGRMAAENAVEYLKNTV